MEIAVTNNENTATSLVISNQRELAKKIDNVISEVMQLPEQTNGFEKAFVHSSAISKISELLTPEYFKPILELQNKKLGFLTDSKEGYKPETVKDCVIEAVLTGVQVVGNQFNILVGKCYITKEGFTYLLRKIEDLTYDIVQHPPKATEGGSIVTTTLKYKYKGKDFSRDISFPIKVNSGMGSDGILGKAERKVKKWLYNEITGKEVGDGDTIDIDHEDLSKKNTNKTQAQTQQGKSEEKQKPQAQNQPQEKESNKPEFVEETNSGIDEAIIMVDEKKQGKFDNHIKKSKSKDELGKKSGEVIRSYGLKLENFDLTVYNELLATLQ